MPPSHSLRVLFVDDEPAVLRMLRTCLQGMSPGWEVECADQGGAALAMMEDAPFDVVVTDMRMDGISGAELTNELLRRFPQTVRLVMSGYADEELTLKCLPATHQYLAKPLDLKRLDAILRGIAALGARIGRASVRAAVTGTSRLPCAPAIQARLIQALELTSCSTRQVGEVVACDPSLASEVLKFTNSAFFGFTREVWEVAEAVQLLGVGTLRSLALTFGLFPAFDSATCAKCALESVWSHSRRTAVVARQIAQAESADRKTIEQAFTAGLLHDIGKVVLAAISAADYAPAGSRAPGQNGGVAGLELEIQGIRSADVGAYLLALWGLPLAIVDAAAHYAEPRESADLTFSPLTAVHVASAVVRGNNALDPKTLAGSVDVDYLSRLKLANRLPDWLAAAVLG